MDPELTPPSPGPAPAPTPAPPPPTPPPAPGPTPAPSFQEGGTTSGGGWFKGVTVMSVGIIALTSLALCYSIYYSRQRIMYLRNEKTKDRADIEDLKSQMAQLQIVDSNQYGG